MKTVNNEFFQAVTELAESRVMYPVLIRFSDNGELMVVSRTTTMDISWSERDREFSVVASQQNLADIADKPVEFFDAEDVEACVEYLNHNC